MTALDYLTIGVLTAILLLGGLVVARNPRNKVNASFGLMTLGFLFWLTMNFLVDFSNTLQTALSLTKLTNLFGIIGTLLFFVFTIIITNNPYPKLNRTLIAIMAFFAIVLSALTLFTKSIVGGVYLKGGIYGNEAGWAMPLLMTYFIFGMLGAVIILAVAYKKTVGFRKQQLKFIILGLSLFSVFALLFNLLIPYLTGNLETINLTPIASMFFIGFTSYAIIKHHFMDIRMVVARSVAYVILLAALAAFYAGTVLGLERLFFPSYYSEFNFAQAAMRTIISVIMVFLFQPLRKWITKATDRVFFRNQYDPDTLLSELSSTMGSTIVLIELLYKVGDIIQRNLKASRVLFAIIRDDTHMYAVQANGYKQTPDVDPRDVLKLCKDGIIHYDDLEDGTHLKRMLTEYQANLVVPLRTEGEIIGVMMIGEKSSGDMYSQQDLSVLDIIGPEMALAIENAKAYEEISRFNTTLRQEVKRATSRLKMKNEQLMELDHAKDEFISMASHQLRTPLTAIKGYLSMLLEGDAGDIKVSQYDFINEAYSGANRMVGLINDLLNVSRMDTGRFFLEQKDVDIEKLVGEEVKQLQNAAKTKGLYLNVEAKGRLPHIWADETKIRQVVMNFMDNAIYYTNNGGVTVVLKHDKNNFIYEVHDTGIGVPKAQRDHMFEKFFRADNARTARPDGTGLGIYLAKRVVEDHGGEITFSSEEGKGSVFGFKFPLKKSTTSKLTSTPSSQPAAAPMPTATEIAAKAE